MNRSDSGEGVEEEPRRHCFEEVVLDTKGLCRLKLLVSKSVFALPNFIVSVSPAVKAKKKVLEHRIKLTFKQL